MREKISACVITGNEELNIRRCLESLTWCDELIVVDSFSQDKTVKICEEFTDRVYQHQWLGYIGQKNLIRGLASHPWVLFLDADEEVTGELREEIERELENPGDIVGYRFPRVVFYLNRWITHGEWYPDMKLRLFRKEKGRSAGREPHDHVVVNGRVKTLRGCIHHYTYSSIEEHLDTMNRFSTITAQEKFKCGEKFSYLDWFFRPGWRFLKSLFFKRGILDGFPGLVIAYVSALGVAMKYAKLWEYQLNEKLENGPAPSNDDSA